MTMHNNAARPPVLCLETSGGTGEEMNHLAENGRKIQNMRELCGKIMSRCENEMTDDPVSFSGHST